jgi:hypothetical protein
LWCHGAFDNEKAKGVRVHCLWCHGAFDNEKGKGVRECIVYLVMGFDKGKKERKMVDTLYIELTTMVSKGTDETQQKTVFLVILHPSCLSPPPPPPPPHPDYKFLGFMD